MYRARLYYRKRLGELSGERHGLRYKAAGGSGRVRQAAGADLHAEHQGKHRSAGLGEVYPGKGADYAAQIRDKTIALYRKCADYALGKGIIIADTKFEFGLDEDGNVVLGDEMLTPDSSRFWPLEGYEAGKSQPSFDKQFVRDWLKANPDNDLLLPDEVVEKTVDKYKEAFELLTGKAFEA